MHYLQEPPILIPPVQGNPLIMYLKVLEGSMGCVLGKHDETGRKEHAFYYIRKRFTYSETRYSMLEKTCYALTSKTMHANSYYLVDILNGSIKYIFEKSFDIQKAIKGSVL